MLLLEAEYKIELSLFPSFSVLQSNLRCRQGDFVVHLAGLTQLRRTTSSIPGDSPEHLPVLQGNVFQPLGPGLLARDRRGGPPVVQVAPHLLVAQILRVVVFSACTVGQT